MSEVVKLAEKSLQRGDKVEKTYPGTLDGNWGYIIITNQKILFVKEEGLFFKKRTVMLNLPYNKIDKLEVKDRYDMEIYELDGPKHDFHSEVSAEIVEEAINKNMKKNL